jgi:hypothetical protein
MKTTSISLLFVLLLTLPATATTLTFDGLGLTDFVEIPSTLGSNATVDGPGYNVTSGTTPNISVSMTTVNDSGAINVPNLLYWSTDYGDLVDVAFAVSNGDYARVTLTADSGYAVNLQTFDLAGYPAVDWLADRIRVYDGAGTVLWNQDGTTVLGAGPAHSSYAPNITGSTLILEYGSNWNIGLDNLTFVQVVPEPSSLLLGSLAGLALLRRRRRG